MVGKHDAPGRRDTEDTADRNKDRTGEGLEGLRHSHKDKKVYTVVQAQGIALVVVVLVAAVAEAAARWG